MSKKDNKNKTKKDRWVLKFIAIAIVFLLVAIVAGKTIPSLPNILGLVYVVFGLVWFFMHTKVTPEK